ncbi:YdeI/OmpD-associated family protein [bacterium]|nr:MAG: YdeI/OmpD-associated family protein [bacterium]
MSNKPDDFLTLTFATPAVWEAWLAKNHATSTGLWLKIAKKASGVASVTYDEALAVALCYGWIDGLKRTYDATYFIQRFTPRRARSIWSKRNIGKITELTAAGRMQPAGQAEVERAQADGRWAAAYDSPANMEVPADFVAAVERSPVAAATFAKLSRSNLYAIAWRLTTVKTAVGRQRRFDALLAMLERGETIH